MESTFEYLGKVFTPFGKRKWDDLVDAIWGDYIKMEGYNHGDFYKAAGTYNTYDIFLLDGEKVVPANDGFRYFGEPDFSIQQRTKNDLKILFNKRVKEEVEKIESTLLKKINSSLLSGAFPDELGDEDLVKIVIYSFCKENLELPSKLKKLAENLHLFI